MNKQQIQVSYNVEITYTSFGKECVEVIENIDASESVLTLPQVQSTDYTNLSLVTVVKDADGNIINEFTCRVD
jgi:hypothetical protein